ncbi:hypothetical protein [Paenibacillus chibensis]|uniref:hypothetical protein n=1 Tax=Paenibacillus chibensis TaxID=59846 RepID=UPI000FD859DE|nr:hypothetical protein [Paenibacillus chibensis]MEC0369619.1 hypothetical protein [Paenibacillus chibensis]
MFFLPKRVVALLILLFFTCAENDWVQASADPKSDREKEAEALYRQYGYTSVEKAKADCEKKFGSTMPLPRSKPKVSFTHAYGRCNFNEKDPMNNELELEYIHMHQSGHHYKVEVRPVEYKIRSSYPERMRTVSLHNGSKAEFWITPGIRGFYVLFFDKYQWQYIVSVDKRIGTNTPEKLLTEIADSLE